MHKEIQQKIDQPSWFMIGPGTIPSINWSEARVLNCVARANKLVMKKALCIQTTLENCNLLLLMHCCLHAVALSCLLLLIDACCHLQMPAIAHCSSLLFTVACCC